VEKLQDLHQPACAELSKRAAEVSQYSSVAFPFV